MSINSKMDKQIEVYSHNGVLHSNENEQTTTACNNINELPKQKVERSQT